MTPVAAFALLAVLALLGSACVPGQSGSGAGAGSPIQTPAPAGSGSAAALGTAASATAVVAIGASQLGSQEQTPNSYDRDFIDAVVPRLQAEVEMARMAASRAQHQELRDFATELIDSDSTDIGEMQLWRQAWFGSSQTPALAPTPQMQALRTASDATFDRGYIDAMLPLQAQLMDQAREALLHAGAQEILDTAGELLAEHSRAALQLQGWRSQW